MNHENISKFEIIDSNTLIFSLKGMPCNKEYIDHQEHTNESNIYSITKEDQELFQVLDNSLGYVCKRQILSL